MADNHFINIGADIGGTFTDVVVIDERAKKIHSAKVLTTPERPEQAVLNAVNKMLRVTGTSAKNICKLVHGTTLATNAIIEGKGAKTLLLTTNGFRDALETRDELRYDLHDLFIQFPTPLVPRRRRIGINERVLFNGKIEKALEQQDIYKALKNQQVMEVESVAICFLHSYANSENEIHARELIEKNLPNIPISISSEVLPEIGEYARTSTTVANAYVQPLINRYLEALNCELCEQGLSGAFFVMGSNAGTLSLDIAKKFPVRLVESGPAAGVSIAAHYAETLNLPKLLSFDMGGTTAKIALVTNGHPTSANELEVARVKRFQKGSGLLLKAPAVELIEIGAGGGSVASVDELGLLSVGPESAGSSPGPACYGKGGEAATVTDADLILGYLNTDYFLGGQMPLDFDSAKQVIDERISKYLSLETQEAASSIFNVVNDNMANAAAVYAAEQGIDIRSYTLMAFGGAAPTHAWDVARRLGITEIRVPLAAGVLSALGCLVSPVSFDFVFGYMSEIENTDWDYVNSRFSQLEKDGRQQLENAGINENVEVKYSADMRYFGQRYEVSVGLKEVPISKDMTEKITKDFLESYEQYYGRIIHDVPVETVSWRVRVTGPRPELGVSWKMGSGDNVELKTKGKRPVVFTPSIGPVICEVYERSELCCDTHIDGPAVIEDTESTIIIPPGGAANVDENLMIIINISNV